ncbi:MAG: isoleucine--tRNA ligase, partial [Clostridia bacterium]|nr:isoleucine--tRNA ligase [Clostridia bacterium]
GPKYGKKLGLIKQFLETCNANEVVKTVRQGNPYNVELGGEEVVFEESDLLIATESREGFISASENGNTVVLDVNLTKELIDEGLVREIVSRVQTMRKEADFKVTDRINLYYVAEGQIARIFKEYGDRIAKATLTANISEGKAEGYQKDWELNEEAITLTVQKVGQ